MRGFKLVALSDKGREAVAKQNIPDKRMNVIVESEDPYTLTFSYKDTLFRTERQRKRFYERVEIIKGVVYAKIKKEMKKKHGCLLGPDYDIQTIS